MLATAYGQCVRTTGVSMPPVARSVALSCRAGRRMPCLSGAVARAGALSTKAFGPSDKRKNDDFKRRGQAARAVFRMPRRRVASFEQTADRRKACLAG